MSVIYNSALPENNKDSYTEYDTVDFVLTYENQSLQLGSLRLEGDIDVKQNGLFLNDPLNVDKDIKMDRHVGAHAVCESIQTEMLGEIFESITEYPRLVKHYAVARNTASENFNSSRVCELRTPIDVMTTAMLQGSEVSADGGATKIRKSPDFSIKPDMILNSSTDLLPFERSGAVRVSFNLARMSAVLWGLDVTGNTTYSLKDLRLVYRTVPVMDNKEPITLRRRINIKQSIQSSLANVAVKVPSPAVEAFSSSFQVQSQEMTYKANNLDMEKVPNLEELTFLFNDQTNTAVSYLIRDNVEVVDKFIDALGDTKRNDMSPANLANNDAYGIGLKMSSPIDLTNQKFSVQINSQISNTRPLIYYMFFHTIVTM